jgi:general secretion pathway protein A
MYTTHFGLTAEPFSLTPDPEFLYLSPGHAEALAALKIGLLGRRGVILMTGEVGTGKTTLTYALMHALGDTVRTAYVSNTRAGFDALLQLALADFGVTPASAARIDLLTALNRLLRECAEHDVTATLIVDEAQNLDPDTFEQLRLLTNFETFTHKLLQIVLVGQPELAVRMREPALRALTERVAVHCQLAPLGERESRAYLDYRLLRAGGSTRLFDHDARGILLAAATGLPRRINILSHTALLFAYGRGAARVTRPIAELAVAQRAALFADLAPFASRAAPAAPPAPVQAGRWRPALAFAAAALVTAVAVAAIRVGARPAGAPVNAAAGVGEGEAPFDRGLLAAAPSAAAAAAVEPALPAERLSTSDVVAAPDNQPAAEPPSSVSAADAPDGGRADAEAVTAPAVVAPPLGESRVRIVRVAPGATLGSLIRDVYGASDPALLRRVQLANPQVTNIDHILAGDVLRFPEVATMRPEGQTP